MAVRLTRSPKEVGPWTTVQLELTLVTVMPVVTLPSPPMAQAANSAPVEQAKINSTADRPTKRADQQ